MLLAVNLLIATTKKSGSSLSPILLLVYVVLFGGLYFFYFRKVELGERAQTIGGFVGTVIKMDDGLVTLRGASGVELDFIPTAIARRFDPPTPVPESSDDEHNEEGDKP